MSYARWGENGSRVYIFLDRNPSGGTRLCCHTCLLQTEVVKGTNLRHDFLCEKASEMLEHVREHRQAGHRVPQRCFDRLEEESNDA